MTLGLSFATHSLSLGDLKVGDAIAVGGAYDFSVPGLIETLAILRINGVPQPSLYAGWSQVTFADPIFYVAGWPIATDSSTTYSGFGLTRAAFFQRQWPYTDVHCQPSVRIVVGMNPDGSLTALSVKEWAPSPMGGC
jgi:hypothetical protein